MKIKYPPIKPRRILWINFVMVPDGHEVFVAPKGEFFLSKRSDKPRKGADGRTPSSR